MADNEISILVKAEVEKALKDLKKVQDAPKDMDKSFGSFFTSMKSGWLLIAGIVSGVVVKTLENLTKKGIEFLDLNEDFISFFRGIEKEAVTMRSALVNAYGYSTTEATKLLATNANLLKNMGLTGTAALDMAGQIGKVAAALGDSNTVGYNAEQVAEAIRKALTGQARELKNLGIVLDDDTIKRKAQEMGLIGVNDKLDQASKAQATLAIITDKSKRAMDEFSVSGSSLEEKLKRTNAVLEDLKTAIGIELANKIKPVIDAFASFSVAGDRMETLRTVAKKSIDGIILAASLLFAPFEIIGRAIGGLITGVIQSVFHFRDSFSLLMNTGFLGAAKAFASGLGGILTNIVTFASNAISALSGIGTAIKKSFSGDTKGAADEMAKSVNGVATATKNLGTDLNKTLGDSAKAFDNAFSQETALKSLSELGSAFADLGKGALQGSGIGAIYDTIAANINRAKELINGTTENINATAKKGNADKNETIIKDNAKTAEQLKKIADDTAIYNTFIASDETAKKEAELKKQYDAAILATDAIGYDSNLITAKYEAEKVKITQEANDKITQGNLAVLSAYTNAAQAAGDFAMQIVQNQIDAENAGGKQITQEQKNRLKEAAKAQKALAVFQAAVNTASAIIAALATPLIGPALSIAAGITGAIQTGIILAKPIPEFAKGGLVNGPQMILAGERGTEAVLPAELTTLLMNAAGAGNNGTSTVINIAQVVANNPEEFSAQMDRYVKRNGRIINT
jgi:hypothetical protein